MAPPDAGALLTFGWGLYGQVSCDGLVTFCGYSSFFLFSVNNFAIFLFKFRIFAWSWLRQSLILLLIPIFFYFSLYWFRGSWNNEQCSASNDVMVVEIIKNVVHLCYNVLLKLIEQWANWSQISMSISFEPFGRGCNNKIKKKTYRGVIFSFKYDG